MTIKGNLKNSHMRFYPPPFSFFISGQHCERVQTAPAWRLALDVFDVAVRAETELSLSKQPEFSYTISF